MPLNVNKKIRESKKMGFGETVKKLRIAKGLTQVDLASLIGVSRAYITRIETEPDVNPTWRTIEAMANALDVSADAFRMNPAKKKSKK